MAKRNRKKSDGYIFPMPLATILFMITVFGLCLLFLKGRSEALGREIKALEVQRVALREKLRQEESRASV